MFMMSSKIVIHILPIYTFLIRYLLVELVVFYWMGKEGDIFILKRFLSLISKATLVTQFVSKVETQHSISNHTVESTFYLRWLKYTMNLYRGIESIQEGKKVMVWVF
jgi:hypothetical protein